MDYVVECELSAHSPTGVAFGLNRNLTLLLYTFSEETRSPDNVRTAVQEAVNQATQEFSNTLYVEVESISARSGSVTVVITLTVIAANPPAGVVIGSAALGTLALWAADKALGGALHNFGEFVMKKTLGKLFPGKQVAFRDVEAAIAAKAWEAAGQRNCRAVILKGPDKSPDGRGYVSIYELVGCKDKGHVTVTVPMRGTDPVSVTVVQSRR